MTPRFDVALAPPSPAPRGRRLARARSFLRLVSGACASPRSRRFVGHAAWAALLSLTWSAFVFGPWLLSLGAAASAAAGGAALVAIGAAVLALRRGRFRSPAWAGRPGVWAAIVGAGAMSRLAWAALMPVTLASDPRDYRDAAVQLLAEGRYFNLFGVADPEGQWTGRVVELLAWRPPGLAFLLAGWFAAFGAGSWSIVAFNLAIYALSALVLGAVALRLTGRGAVAPVLLAFALWPKHIAYTGLPQSEGPSLLLLTLGVLLFDRALAGDRRSVAYAGLTYGAAALVRPSLLLLPALWAGMAWVARGSFQRRMLPVVAATAVGLAVIAPWTARNWAVLGHPVLISTNGGDVLYRANNPRASGGFMPAGERYLNALVHDEVRWNEAGGAWAREWMRSDPIGFVKLAVRKLGLLWGCEEEGVLFAVHHPEVAAAERAFTAGANALMNAWWFVLLCAVAASLVHRRAALTRSPLAFGLLAAPLLLTAVHLLYESHARYHLPFVGALIVLACAGPFPAAPVRTSRAAAGNPVG